MTICLKNQTSDADLPTNLYCQEGGVKSLVKKRLITGRQSHTKSRKIKNPETSTKPTQAEKLEFDEAFDSLPANQKRYFNEIKDFALKQPNARPKPTKQHFTVGAGNTAYVKFVIKYSNLIASIGATEVKLENDHSVKTAKQMIDTRVKKLQEKI